MARKMVRTGKLVVSFISTAGTNAHYEVYDVATDEKSRIGHDTGTFTACGREPTALEIAAVQAFLDEEKAEFIVWKREFDAKQAQS
jgi:hypothetical protein